MARPPLNDKMRIAYLRSRSNLVLDRKSYDRPRWTHADASELSAALDELAFLRKENRRLRRILFRNQTTTAVRGRSLGSSGSNRVQNLR